MREVAFEIESSLSKPIPVQDNHVFVSGLARSGTTVLLNSLYETNVFASLSYLDMPFTLAPNLWSKIHYPSGPTIYRDRLHGDGLKIAKSSPEAFEEVFWKTFDQNEAASMEKFRLYINQVTHRYKKVRYLSKNNQNIRRLQLLSNAFPNSRILVPFRNPFQQSFSLLTQHQKFVSIAKQDWFVGAYMKWVGHTEFGPFYASLFQPSEDYADPLTINHWLEQWIKVYRFSLRLVETNPNIRFVCYEQMCASNKYWLDLLDEIKVIPAGNNNFSLATKRIALEYDHNLGLDAQALYERLSLQ